MNKALLPILSITLILTACTQHKKTINFQYVPSEQAEVTTLAFDATAHSDTNFRRMMLESINYKAGREIDDDYAKQLKHESDSLKNELDTGKIYVFIADTLIRIPQDYLKTLIKLEKNNKAPSKRQNVTNSWAAEININDSQGLFNMKNLAFDYNYEYVLLSELKPDFDKILSKGIFRMSAIFFNPNQTKAFVYTEIKSRIGFEIFLLKKNGKWMIIKKHIAWIT